MSSAGTSAAVEPTDRESAGDERIATSPSPKIEGLLIDTHVHVHPCFDASALFQHAASNFAKARRELECSSSTPGCLLLTENATDDFFYAMKTGRQGLPGWCVEPTREACSLLCRPVASASRRDVIFLIAGRQIVVREGIEVLALCTDRRFPVGRSLKSTLESVIRAGAIPVLPWGFGKWWLSRGTLVRKVLESGFCERVFVGDNSNRLRFGPSPRLFEVATTRGTCVLPGSDPLPMKGRERDAARCGIHLPGEADFNRPAAWIMASLDRARANGSEVSTFGCREGLMRFVMSQISMQIRRTA